MPKVPKSVLFIIAGLLWASVGIFLIRLSHTWFIKFPTTVELLVILAGLIAGSIVSYFGFSKIADKNIYRINNYEGKVCIWAFQKWTSYLLIAFMMSLGIFLRSSNFIPKYVIVFIYITIGTALFTSSFRYFQFLIKKGFKSRH